MKRYTNCSKIYSSFLSRFTSNSCVAINKQTEKKEIKHTKKIDNFQNASNIILIDHILYKIKYRRKSLNQFQISYIQKHVSFQQFKSPSTLLFKSSKISEGKAIAKNKSYGLNISCIKLPTHNSYS